MACSAPQSLLEPENALGGDLGGSAELSAVAAHRIESARRYAFDAFPAHGSLKVIAYGGPGRPDPFCSRP